MKSDRTWVIAWREWKTTVLRRNFLIVTFGLPLIFMLIDGIAYAGIFFSTAKEVKRGVGENRPVAVCDPGHVLNRKPFAAPIAGTQYEIVDLNPGLRGVVSSQYRALVEVPPDYITTGNLKVYRIARGGIFADAANSDNQLYFTAMKAGLISGQVPEPAAMRVISPLLQANVKVFEWNPEVSLFQPPDPLKKTARFIVPYAFSLLLLMSILMGTGYLLQGIVEEKENRVMEVLLSSVTHEELLRGKLIGLGGAGLTQMAVWISLPALLLLIAMPHLPKSFHIDPGTFGIAMVLCGLGFAFYGTIVAGFGCLGSTPRESQQVMGFVILFPIFPLMLMTPILEAPNDVLPRVLSWFPPTAPITLMLRSGVEKVPLWDMALGIGMLIASIWFSQKITAKFFRLGLLLTGKTPTPAEVMRWLRAS